MSSYGMLRIMQTATLSVFLLASLTTFSAKADAPQYGGNPLFNNMKLAEEGNPILSQMRVVKTGAMQAEPLYASQCSNTINDICGGSRMRCCDHLVCTPVMDYDTFKITPRCVVPDASLLDPDICYKKGESCFYNHQCCTGFCEDLDGDSKYTCGTGTTRPTLSQKITTRAAKTSTTSTSSTSAKKEEAVNFEDNQNAHYGKISRSFPIASTILFITAISLVLIYFAWRKWNKRRGRFEVLGVDKIPEKRCTSGTEGFADVLENENIDFEADIIAEHESEEPPSLPPRDYGMYYPSPP
eukprot:m.11922 g.11922  ORF g.11922 m.11922 type:complete len:298 (-) comp4556_c0_seq1:182-1075(-)